MSARTKSPWRIAEGPTFRNEKMHAIIGTSLEHVTGEVSKTTGMSSKQHTDVVCYVAGDRSLPAVAANIAAIESAPQAMTTLEAFVKLVDKTRDGVPNAEWWHRINALQAVAKAILKGTNS